MVRNYWPVSKFYFRHLLGGKQPFFGLFFQITNRCNSRCLMCFNWQVVNKLNDELSLEEIKKFSQTIGQIPNLTLGGGEPFLRDDLVEICRIFSENNQTRKIIIPTNSLSTERILDSTRKILKSCPVKLKIVLSLDGVGQVHDRIRGVEGNFNKVLEIYQKLHQISKENRRLQLSVNTTISDKNENQIAEIIDYVDKNLEVSFHTLEIIRGCYNQKNVQAPSIENYRQLISQILKSKTSARNKYHQLIYSYYHQTAFKILKEKKQLIPCRTASFMPVIDAVGNVYHCEILPAIGNLRETGYDFFKIWNSDKAKQQQKNISRKKCHCTHYCYQIQNIPMSPVHFFKAMLSE